MVRRRPCAVSNHEARLHPSRRGAGAARQDEDYRPPSGPITRSGRYVEISGRKHSTTTAAIIRSTNGSVPQITSLKGISGATVRITKIFKPTGGVKNTHLHTSA